MRKFVFSTCKHSPVNVLNFEKVSYFASDRLSIDAFDGDLIVNLTDQPGLKAASNVYDIPQLSKHMLNVPEEIVLAWNDYSTPPVKSTFWKALHSYINKKYNSACFHCEHGHGRTGTAICAMLISVMEMDVDTAISYIRETYCTRAVESTSQINYLIDLDIELNSASIVREDIINKFLNISSIDTAEEDHLDFSKYVRMGK